MSDETSSSPSNEIQPAAGDAPRFRLFGSLQTDLTAEEMGDWIDENRRHQAALARAKLADLLESD